MHGANNYFILIDEWAKQLVFDKSKFVKNICSQKEYHSIDSVLFLSKTSDADFEMKIYDRDGSKESMCGNGIRCIAKYFFENYTEKKSIQVKTPDGNKNASLSGNQIKVDMGLPRDVQKIGNFYYTYTGCPHLVCVSEKYVFKDNNSSFEEHGRKLSHNKEICSQIGIHYNQGMYVNFVNPKTKEVVTYERHIKRCTLACGTGNTAVGYILYKFFNKTFPIKLINRGGIIEIGLVSNELTMTGPVKYVKRTFLDN